MPIITRQLDYVRPQRDGNVRVQERLIDSQGNKWFHSYKITSETAAIERMNARDLSDQLKNIDFKDLLIWVQDKNLPIDFDFSNRDLDVDAGEKRLLIWFAEHTGAKAITIAWWIENLGVQQFRAIQNRVGYDNDTGSRIQDRAISLFTAEPFFNSLENTP